MVNYQLGKVYKIVGNGKIYVGSTCKRLLCQRLSGHNCVYKSYQKGKGNNVTSFQCLSDPDHYIELLELCPSDSKDELHKCERKWIEELECVNKCIVGRTLKEYKEVVVLESVRQGYHTIGAIVWTTFLIFKHQQSALQNLKKLA